jgi:hypothetical protein
LILALALAAGACKKNMAPASAMYDYDDDASGMAMGAPEAEPTMDAPVEEADVESGARFERKKAKRSDLAKDTMASPPAPAKTPAGGEVTKPEPADAPPDEQLDQRHIIYTANMTVSVFSLEDALAKAEALPEAMGGYVHSMDGGTMVLRVPGKKLRKALLEIAALGVVEHRSLAAQDVSAEYVDIESRIRALETTQKQLLELMGKARTVDEALHVRQALDGVTSELEVLKGRMRQLDNLIAYATITLTLMERGPHTPVPSSNDPFKYFDSLGVEATEWK